MHYSLEECINNNEYNNLKEQLPLAKDSYVMKFRLVLVQRQEPNESTKFYIGHLFFFINFL